MDKKQRSERGQARRGQGLGRGGKRKGILVKNQVCVDYDSPKIKGLDFPKWKRQDEGEGSSVSHRSALS